jgi:hypothetical protein
MDFKWGFNNDEVDDGTDGTDGTGSPWMKQRRKDTVTGGQGEAQAFRGSADQPSGRGTNEPLPKWLEV